MSFKRTPSTAVDVPDMKRVPSVGSLSTNKARHALDVVVDDVSYTVTNAKAPRPRNHSNCESTAITLRDVLSA